VLDGRDAVVDGVTLGGNWWWGTESLEKDGCFFHATRCEGVRTKAASVNAAFPGDLPLMRPPGTDWSS
jgi:hypothetical protein